MCWNHFLTNDLCSPFYRYLSEYFESMNEVNFPETRHLGLQFEYKNETIPSRVKSDMIFRSWLYKLLQQLRENRTLLAPHSHQSPHLMYQISPKAKMRSRFMFLYQPSLNGLPFIFLPPLLYKPLISFISTDTQKPSLLPFLEF